MKNQYLNVFEDANCVEGSYKGAQKFILWFMKEGEKMGAMITDDERKIYNLAKEVLTWQNKE